jgi:hypothetical protein
MENNPVPKKGFTIREAVVPPKPITYKFMKELDAACDRFFSKRGIKHNGFYKGK